MHHTRTFKKLRVLIIYQYTRMTLMKALLDPLRGWLYVIRPSLTGYRCARGIQHIDIEWNLIVLYTIIQLIKCTELRTRSLWRSLLTCEVIFITPTNIKNIPSSTDKLFSTIDPMLAGSAIFNTDNIYE